MKIVVTGASGFIGRHLLNALAAHTLTVLSRNPDAKVPPGARLAVWDPMEGPPPTGALEGAGAVVHLAGEPVGQRWTEAAMRRILDSRVTGTRHLVDAFRQMPRPPGALVCASATGYYGSRGNEILPETAAPGYGFLPEVCTAWENEAEAAAGLGVRVVHIRTGIALAPHGGALQRMLPPFRLGFGGPLGSGLQWMPWIHVADLASLFRYAVEQPVRGAFNGTAPHPIRNRDFARLMGKTLRRPALVRVPAIALRALFGEMAELLLGSQRAVPAAAVQTGFRFEYPEIEAALAALLR